MKTKNLFILLAACLAIYFILSRFIHIRIKGDLLDAVYVPDSAGDNLWIITDGTFRYTAETQTPGRYSIETKGLGKKTWLYHYSMKNKKILGMQKIKHKTLPGDLRLIRYGDDVWFVNANYKGSYLNVFDINTGETKTDLNQFTSRYPILSAGILNFRYNENYVFNGYTYIDIETNDGRKAVYTPEYDTLFNKLYDLEKDYNKRNNYRNAYFKIGFEPNSGSGIRKILYKDSWYKLRISKYIPEEGVVREVETDNLMTKTEPFMTDKVYLNGAILFQNQQYIIVLHDASIGSDKKDMDRLLTCVDTTGNVLWQKNLVAEISKKLRRSEEGLATDNIFVTQAIHIRQNDDFFVVVFTKSDDLIIALRCIDGKEMWRVEL